MNEFVVIVRVGAGTGVGVVKHHPPGGRASIQFAPLGQVGLGTQVGLGVGVGVGVPVPPTAFAYTTHFGSGKEIGPEPSSK